MSDQSCVEESTRDLRKRMLDLTKFEIIPLPRDSPYIKTIRMQVVQNAQKLHWEIAIPIASVSIVIYNTSRKKLVFVRQFRPIVYYSAVGQIDGNRIDCNKYPASLGFTLELCSGIVDKEKPLNEIAQDEILEECGYEVPLSELEEVITYRFGDYAATKQTLFYAEVNDDMKKSPDYEELIEVVELSIDEIKEYLNNDNEQINLAPDLYGITWFLLNKKNKYNLTQSNFSF